MSTHLTLFTATLVQDSALSVSGLDRETSSDQPFALNNDGVPTLVGRGLKGAAVAMAKRFFDPLPRSISEETTRKSAYRRSVWEFTNSSLAAKTEPQLRSGVGICHKTGARAKGVLYDREVIPASTRWPLEFRVDWSYADGDAVEAEGILGYVLAEHWAEGRCWLGGGAARGLGWCHIENLEAYRLDADAYERWVASGRKSLPARLAEIPTVEPTRSWCFRTLDVKVTFGEYRPDNDGVAWGLDMFAVGPHDADRTTQSVGNGVWAKPSWFDASQQAPDTLDTDRAIAMAGGSPLLSGSSVRGPMRHAFSRAKVAAGQPVKDPHPCQGNVGDSDPGGGVFGSVEQSSRVLIRDSRAEGDWFAAKLHMHAEDELSAGSYSSAKRDAVRVLQAKFPVRVVVEGPDKETVEPLVAEVDRLVALGAIGHLPIGGHKTRGAGWGKWEPEPWATDYVTAKRRWEQPESINKNAPKVSNIPGDWEAAGSYLSQDHQTVSIRVSTGALNVDTLTLGEALRAAREALGKYPLVAWWCEPAIDLSRNIPPAVFGRQWPEDMSLRVEEVSFFAERTLWRAAQTAVGPRWIYVEEVGEPQTGMQQATVIFTPAQIHGDRRRFDAAETAQERIILREWHTGDGLLGFTLEQEAC